MATRAQRHSAALAKREARLADERATGLAAQRKDQEQRYWKSEEAKKAARERSRRTQEKLEKIAAAAHAVELHEQLVSTPLDQDVPIIHEENI